GTLDIVLLNMEPSLTRELPIQIEPREERAPILRIVQPEDDPWRALDKPLSHRSRMDGLGLRRLRNALVPRHPVVFCHGLLAFTTFSMALPEEFNYFTHLRSFLQDRGHRTIFPKVTPTGGVVARAQQLKE